MDKKETKPVVTGTVKQQKKTGLQKIAGIAASNLEKNDVKNRIINDIVLPMILDMVTTGLAGMFGIDATKGRKALDGVVSTVRSADYWNRSNNTGKIETVNATVRSVYDFDNPIYATLGDAETVVRNLNAYIDKYQKVSVADILELSAIVPKSTDYKYGWTTLANVDIVHVAEGYMIRMPKPSPID
jgi:hypothetical protein